MVSFLPPKGGRPSSNATPHAAQQQQSRAERATPTHSPLLPCRTNPPPPPTQLQLHRSIHSSLLRPAARLHPSSPVPAPPPNPSFTCPSRPVCSASPRPARAPFSPPDFRTSDRPRLRLLPARPAGGAPRHCPRRQVLLLSLVWSAGRRLRGRTN